MKKGNRILTKDEFKKSIGEAIREARRTPELKEFFEEVIERFNCPQTVEEEYNRMMSKLVRDYYSNSRFIKILED